MAKFPQWQILVATHKPYAMPTDPLYLPLQVGATGQADLGFTPDNTGDNIAVKNPYYCELTGLYWAWKNLDAAYLGLVHYRRYFAGKTKLVVNGKTKKILSADELTKLLTKTDVVLPKKRHYYIETLYTHYAHTLFIEPLVITGEIIAAKYPAYLPEFNRLKKRRSAHMFNLLIMKKDLLDAYCTWLFAVLFELEQRMAGRQYASFQARFYGRISELLLDVWLNTNHITYREVKVVSTERIAWGKKMLAFLKAKGKNIKYDRNF